MVIPWKWTLLRATVENRGRYQLFLLPSMLPAGHRHPAKAPSRRFARRRRCQKLTRHIVMSRNSWSKFSVPFLPFTPPRKRPSIPKAVYLAGLFVLYHSLHTQKMNSNNPQILFKNKQKILFYVRKNLF